MAREDLFPTTRKCFPVKKKKKKHFQRKAGTILNQTLSLSCLHYCQCPVLEAVLGDRSSARWPALLICVLNIREWWAPTVEYSHRNQFPSLSNGKFRSEKPPVRFNQCRDNPREDAAFLLACVSLQCRDHQYNKSAMPAFLPLSSVFM